MPWIVFGSVSSVVWEGKTSVCGPPWLALNLSYLHTGTEDGAPFIPQIVLKRRKSILNANCEFWLAQEAEPCGPCLHLPQTGELPPKPSCVLWLSVIQVCGPSAQGPTPVAAGGLRTLSAARRCFC